MMEEDKYILLFEKYLNDELPNSEKVSFEEQIEKNSELAKEFYLFKKSVKSIKKNSFRQDVKKLMSEVDKVPDKKSNKYTYISIAASIIFLVISSLIIQSISQKDSLTFVDLYRPYPNILQNRSSNNNDLTLAFNSYGLGDFNEALVRFEKVQPQNDTTLFYSGISHLSLSNFDNAISKFNRIDSTQTNFAEEIDWYLALAYFAKNQKRAALQKLGEIEKGAFKFSEAQALIKQLE